MRYSTLFRNLHRLEQKLDNLVLYVDFYPNRYDLPAILLKDGSLIVLFEFSGVDYEGISQEEKEQLSYYVRSAVEQLPNDGKGFMLSNLFLRGTANIPDLVVREDANPVVKYLQQRKQEFWNELAKRSFQNRSVGCLRYFEHDAPAPWSQLIDDGKAFKFYREQLDARMEKLHLGYVTLRSALDRFGFKQLDKEATFKLLYRIVNCQAPPRYRPDVSLNAQVPNTVIKLYAHKGYLTIGEDTCATVIGVKYPPDTTVGMFLRRFYELDFPLYLKQCFGFADKQKLWKKMDFNKNIANALSQVDKGCAEFVRQSKEYQHRVDNGKELPVWWNFTITVLAANKDDLRERQQRVMNILKEIGSHGLVEEHNFKNGYMSLYPGHERLYLRKSLITTSNVGDLLNAYVLNPGDTEPVEYFQDRLEGVFAYTPFTSRLNAHHLCVTGPTGSGKSFTVNKLLISNLINNPFVYVIDLSRSFTEIFEFLREECHRETMIGTISPERSDFQFNPFLFDPAREAVPEDTQIQFTLNLIKLMIGKEMVTPDVEWELLKCLGDYYRAYGMLLKNTPKGQGLPPLDMLADMVEMEAKQKSIANAIRRWTIGTKGKIFNSGRDSLKLARYCYFDIQDMEADEELNSVVIFTIFAKIMRDITRDDQRNVQKLLFLDEAHRFLKHEEFSFWTELLFRMGRHYRLLTGVITQSVNDLIDDRCTWSKGIVENIKQAVFFNGQKCVDDAFKRFHMSDYNLGQYYAMNGAKREFLYWSADGIRRILRPVTDPYVYWLATTDPEERFFRNAVKEQLGGDIRATIDTCVNLTKDCANHRERASALERYLLKTGTAWNLKIPARGES